MTTDEPSVRYWRNPADPIVVYSTRLDGVAENYDAMPTLDPVLVLTEAELAAHTTAARADELLGAAEEIDRVDFGPEQEVLFSRSSAHRWGARTAATRLRKRADDLTRTPDPNGDNT